MSEIPGHKKKLLDQKWFSEALGVGPPVIAALYGAYAASQIAAIPSWVPWALVAGAVWICIERFVRIRQAISEDEKKSPKGALYASLRVVHAGLLDDGDGANSLRVTLHRVVGPDKNPTEIEQITPYVGGDGGLPGRKFSLQVGVAGLAARSKRPTMFYFERNQVFEKKVEYLIQHYSYTEEAAREIAGKGRLSFLAVPIFAKEGRRVIGVVYFDSTRENRFTVTKDGQVDIDSRIIKLCGGVAAYISETYH